MASTFRCEPCGQSFPSEMLAAHVRTVHGVALTVDLTDPANPFRRTTPKAKPPEDRPRRVEPPKVEPPKVEPPKVEPPKVEPPKVEPAAARSANRLGWSPADPGLASVRERARSHAETVDLLSTAVLLLGLAGAVALALSGTGLAYAAAGVLSTLVMWGLLRAAGILLLLADAAAGSD